jgi:hypothetical protein
LLTKYNQRDKIKDGEIVSSCGTYLGHRNPYRDLVGISELDNLEDLVVDGRVLK